MNAVAILAEVIGVVFGLDFLVDFFEELLLTRDFFVTAIGIVLQIGLKFNFLRLSLIYAFMADVKAVASLAAVIAVAAAFGLIFFAGFLAVLLLIRDFFVTAMISIPQVLELNFFTLIDIASIVPKLVAFSMNLISDLDVGSYRDFPIPARNSTNPRQRLVFKPSEVNF